MKGAIMSNEGNVEEKGSKICAPLVVFCSKCRAILGDSYSWLGADSELRTFSLYDKSKDVIIDEKLETSMKGLDIGSTFTKMHCGSCKTQLGRVYKTTPRSLDHIRDMYTFSIDQVSLYQLGPSEKSSNFIELKNEEMLDLPALSKLQDNMRKAQSLICYLNEKISRLEQDIALINERNQVQDSSSDVDVIEKTKTNNTDKLNQVEKSKDKEVKGIRVNGIGKNKDNEVKDDKIQSPDSLKNAKHLRPNAKEKGYYSLAKAKKHDSKEKSKRFTNNAITTYKKPRAL